MPQVVRGQLDYYVMLEIATTADTAEVNAAFRRLAWRYHPDRNPAPGATLQFQDINEAHQVLSDPARRAEYDAQWHPHLGEHRRTARAPIRPRVYRSTRRRRRVRAVLLGLFALMFVTSAWALVITALTVAHSGGFGEAYYAPSTSPEAASTDCNFKMEIVPVTYFDERGHQATTWDTDVHNCFGGTTHLSNVPQFPQTRAASFTNHPVER